MRLRLRKGGREMQGHVWGSCFCLVLAKGVFPRPGGSLRKKSLNLKPDRASATRIFRVARSACSHKGAAGPSIPIGPKVWLTPGSNQCRGRSAGEESACENGRNTEDRRGAPLVELTAKGGRRASSPRTFRVTRGPRMEEAAGVLSKRAA